jgi:esterase/lipase superfamily enzyme
LFDKGIWCDLSIWGPEMRHDWQTWRVMLPYILGNKF